MDLPHCFVNLRNRYNNWHITTTTFVVVMLLFFVSCDDSSSKAPQTEANTEDVPTMITDSVRTLISDSGITRYNLIADKWLIFDRANEPYWFFPQGIYLERYDKSLAVEATVKADTAWNYTQQRLWKLVGNVHIENVQGEKFFSNEFYWDQRKQEVYSNTYIEIVRGEMMIQAVGLRSNQSMTEWTILKPYDSLIPLKDQEASVDSYDDSPQAAPSSPAIVEPSMNTEQEVSR